MFDIGWPELMVVATVLIVVVGPKDLPGMLRTFGRSISKVRSMANEFRGQFDEALREAELDEVRKAADDLSKLNPKTAMREAMAPFRAAGEDMQRAFKDENSKPDTAASARNEELRDDEMEPFDSPIDAEPDVSAQVNRADTAKADEATT